MVPRAVQAGRSAGLDAQVPRGGLRRIKLPQVFEMPARIQQGSGQLVSLGHLQRQRMLGQRLHESCAADVAEVLSVKLAHPDSEVAADVFDVPATAPLDCKLGRDCVNQGASQHHRLSEVRPPTRIGVGQRGAVEQSKLCQRCLLAVDVEVEAVAVAIDHPLQHPTPPASAGAHDPAALPPP
jgi:hypothetical protein